MLFFYYTGAYTNIHHFGVGVFFIFLSKVKHFALAVVEFYFINYRLFLKVITITWILTLSSKTLASLPRMLSSANCIRVCSVSRRNLATRTTNHSGIGADLSAPNDLGSGKWIIYKFSLSTTFSGSCSLRLVAISSEWGCSSFSDILVHAFLQPMEASSCLITESDLGDLRYWTLLMWVIIWVKQWSSRPVFFICLWEHFTGLCQEFYYSQDKTVLPLSTELKN